MRHSALALVAILFVVFGRCQATAAESGSRWWSFGRGSEASLSQPPAVAPNTPASPYPDTAQHTTPPPTIDAEPEQRWMIESPFAKVSWPRIHMPEMPKPRLPSWPKKSDAGARPDAGSVARNSWVEKNPEAKDPSPLQAMSDGARRVRQSTRSAWDKTVAALTPGDETDSPSSRVTRREVRPPFWKRMFASEPQHQEGPQTVTEWMAQERIDP
jgi:hypothetical protein